MFIRRSIRPQHLFQLDGIHQHIIRAEESEQIIEIVIDKIAKQIYHRLDGAVLQNRAGRFKNIRDAVFVENFGDETQVAVFSRQYGAVFRQNLSISDQRANDLFCHFAQRILLLRKVILVLSAIGIITQIDLYIAFPASILCQHRVVGPKDALLRQLLMKYWVSKNAIDKLDDLFLAAVRGRQSDFFRFVQNDGELLQQIALAAAPAIDGLLFVADHDHAAIFLRPDAADQFLNDGQQNLELNDTGVLKLIDHHKSSPAGQVFVKSIGDRIALDQRELGIVQILKGVIGNVAVSKRPITEFDGVIFFKDQLGDGGDFFFFRQQLGVEEVFCQVAGGLLDAGSKLLRQFLVLLFAQQFAAVPKRLGLEERLLLLTEKSFIGQLGSHHSG